ncbi:MAG: hypothetical protein OET57_18055 [Desulfobacteraceae bacterium]|nr:hypothetical protein [Desulfobacteraceae bacterium]
MGEGQRSFQEGHHLTERETGRGVPFTHRRGALISNNWIERDSGEAVLTLLPVFKAEHYSIFMGYY